MTENTAPSAPTPDQVREPDLPPPADFDLAAWFSGVRSTVRSCTIYQRGDLLAEIEDAERQLRLLEAEDAGEYSMEETGSKEALNARIEALYQELLESGVTFRVEARSPDWIKAKEKEVANSGEAHGLSKEDKARLSAMHQLADAIIEPKGVTVEFLEQLAEVSFPQYAKLFSAYNRACSEAPVVSAPTSPSSSANRRGRGR